MSTRLPSPGKRLITGCRNSREGTAAHQAAFGRTHRRNQREKVGNWSDQAQSPAQISSEDLHNPWSGS